MPFYPAKVAPLQDSATAHWHTPSAALVTLEDSLEEMVLEQHHANFDLWHTEDRARIPNVTGEEMIAIKHDVDRLNQQRNDLAEQVDLALLALASDQNPSAPLHSETPGLMIDRLSILALKIFHTEEESVRPDASEEHRQRNRERLALLLEQRSDLAQALQELWDQVLSGQKRFKLYRQMKMYNDPSLNPAIYNAPGS